MLSTSTMLKEIRAKGKLSQVNLAYILGTSFVSVNRWERSASDPSPAQAEQIRKLHRDIIASPNSWAMLLPNELSFQSRGVRRQRNLFDPPPTETKLAGEPLPPIYTRHANGRVFHPNTDGSILSLLEVHRNAAKTANEPPESGMSAGKNTYTYDAHTYHTKVPPQGIAELLSHYLPDGNGLVLDPFAGSGMTGVASRFKGYDCILNELSPAACFIADRFVSSIEPEVYEAGIVAVLEATQLIRQRLYTTICRECGQKTEILYIVWSYRVMCDHCSKEFVLWDHCRQYGEHVRDHKILSEFSCPSCKATLKKSTLRRTTIEPVMVGYKCCRGGQQEITHSLSDDDLVCLHEIEANPPVEFGYFPRTKLPEGVNLRQPAKHGLDSVDKLYTPRNLAGMSHLWRVIHRVEDENLAAYLAFTFTSLYQRVTRLSEFRFWGGSGNTARFNVPYIFNEANVFLTYERKARTILDHLRTTACNYKGQCTVVRGSATNLDYLPDNSVDLIFTDPPFGANINYSEMNLLWESWLGEFTDNTQEAVINKVQGKDLVAYQNLMMASMCECYRVLRTGHWMLLVFMNSSKEVWNALREAITHAGFAIKKIDIFDKQHGTLKQFTSENTAGFDLVLHCLKLSSDRHSVNYENVTANDSIRYFLRRRSKQELPLQVYLHVGRSAELDYKKLYSEWLSSSLLSQTELVDFAQFRVIAHQVLTGMGTTDPMTKQD